MTHVIPGRRPVAEALRAGRDLRELVVADPQGPLAPLCAAAGEAGVPVRAGGRDELDRLSEGVVHQGVVALASDFPYTTVEQLADARLVVVLDGVTDPHNLGAIARSAEGAGAGGVVLPRRRAAHVTPTAEKSAAGAFSWLRVALAPNVDRALAGLSAAGFWSVGLDGNAPTVLWDCDLLDAKVALVIGAEGAGLSRLVAQRVDALVSLPLAGRVRSLNASVAAAVAMFEVVRRQRGGP